MTKGLENQVFIYSMGTYSFLDDEEYKIFKRIQNLKGYKKKLNKMKSDIAKDKKLSKKEIKIEKKKINNELKKVNHGSDTEKGINKLKKDLYKLIDNHKGVRTLRKEEMKENQIISVFDSVLTRTLEMKIDELSEDVIVIQTYHEKVLEGLIKYGFVNPSGEFFTYFASSAGQIRQKKGVWIKKKLWDEHKDSLTCGLSLDEINNSEKKGCNVNKYLSYKALIFSASEEWNFPNFDIDKCIVVDDLELEIFSKVDFIDRDSYKIERKKMNVPITATDGVGMMLPSVSEKNFMCRLPWIKGLLAVYDFTKHGNTKVTDIDNKVWDVVDDGISVIFTKSQWKMHAYFDSWEDYKRRFKEHNCKAAKLNEEEDEFNDGKINYQMLESLTDVSDEELTDIASSTIKDINVLGEDKETMLKVLGATEANERKRSFQKALLKYPQLLNDAYSKEAIKTKKRSLVNEAKTAKLNVNGSFTFIIPDLYSFCEYLFNGEAKPLLKEDEVHCSLQPEGKVGILRSPHLSREWGIKNNIMVSSDKLKIDEYFKTDAIYVSNESLLSKLIQNDWDGDKVLVLSEHKDETLLRVAERNMKNDKIVPLYYEMEKAKAQEINNQNIYDSLILSFEANIGEISNNICKAWNSNNPDLSIIRIMCMENNFEIDFCKTLFRPIRPPHIDEKIKEYIKLKLPHFFIYDKRKNKKSRKNKLKVEATNESTVNRLERIIPKKNIHFKEVAGCTFDYRFLMNRKQVKVTEDMDIIKKYKELDKNKKKMINANDDEFKKKGKMYVYKYIKQELLKINPNPTYVTDVLIEYLYGVKDSVYKDTLWLSFGEIIERNLERNLNEAAGCDHCGSKFRKLRETQVTCSEKCQKVRERENARLRKKKQREKNIKIA
ncbi:hypothetical protein CN689_14230 [Peribacillus butanolivorans]|uniref:Uncharacterized protein n=1 Tax=Peribacillus butanolivorans TaxID=421767 RepID=A0AAX0S2Z0_9BACI|nr:hypothetical protein [Peribacillus butanolivorans]PEJ32283.1 hypothetical protein CN689_14230 [Peribacillus butanolivorans]